MKKQATAILLMALLFMAGQANASYWRPSWVFQSENVLAQADALRKLCLDAAPMSLLSVAGVQYSLVLMAAPSVSFSLRRWLVCSVIHSWIVVAVHDERSHF